VSTYAETPVDSDLPDDLTDVGIEALLNFDLTVTSPGKKEEKLSNTASAIYVISQEDIRRSGATHIAETLRMVPGVSVARVASNQWAISVRGFNQVFANKLLVLVDGVSIYSPTINGVYWETNELLLEDIERIEVIRGPGAALWGSNAVNGVINIISKDSSKTLGTLLSAGSGTHEEGFVSLRHGTKLGEATTARLWAKFNSRDNNQRFSDGDDANDDWQSASTGFRMDSTPDENNTLQLGGRAHYSEDYNETVSSPSLAPPFIDNETFSGNNYWSRFLINAKWIRQFSEKSKFQLSSDWRQLKRSSALVVFDYDIFTTEAQFRFSPASRHDVVSGIGYRHFALDSEPTFAQDLEPESRKTDLVTFFIQDEITLIEKQLFLILGSKLENSPETETQVMPNARLLWSPDSDNSLWLAYSRAIASPPVVAEDLRVPVSAFPLDEDGNIGVVGLQGSRDVDPEILDAFEVGFRNQSLKNLSFDISLFYNSYDNLSSLEERAPRPIVLEGQSSPSVFIPLEFDNKLAADSYGGELAIEIKPTSYARFITGYSFIRINAKQGDSSQANAQQFLEGTTPQNQIFLRSLFDLPHDVEFDTAFRYVDHLTEGDIGSYFELDARIGWRPHKKVEISIVGQNLLDGQHAEFLGNLFGPPRIEIERSAYVKATVSF
jgi:iron complex outermembrane receptor protein